MENIEFKYGINHEKSCIIRIPKEELSSLIEFLNRVIVALESEEK